VAVVLDLQLVFLIEPDFADRGETAGALTVLIDMKHDDAEDRKVGSMGGVHRATIGPPLGSDGSWEEVTEAGASRGKGSGWQSVRRLWRASDETRSVDGEDGGSSSAGPDEGGRKEGATSKPA